jgi:hypothetical protein
MKKAIAEIRVANRQRLVRLYEELYRADDDFSQVRRCLSKIRAEVNRQDFLEGKMWTSMELDVELSHFILCLDEGWLPTVPEVHREANKKARLRGTSYTERGVRKTIKRLRLEVAESKRGRHATG